MSSGMDQGSFEQTAAGLPEEFGSLEQIRDKVREELFMMGVSK